MKTFVYASDLHGDMQDHSAVEKLLSFCEDFKPDVRVFGGDVFDFRPLRKKAGVAERNESMMCDLEAGLEFLGKFRPNVLTLGNHDDRLWEISRDHENGILRDTAAAGVRSIEKKLRGFKCKIYQYGIPVNYKRGKKQRRPQGFYNLGDVVMCHGYFAGVYATKKHAETFAPPGGICIHGHTHAIQYHSIARLGGGAGMSPGCLAQLDMPYNRRMPGRLIHAHGFCYGYVDGKDWQVFQARKSESGKWIVAKNLEAI